MSTKRAIATFVLEAGPRSVAFHPNDRMFLVTYANRLEVRLSATGEKVWGARFEQGLDGAVFAEEGLSVIAAASPDAPRTSSVPSAERDLVRVSEDEARRLLDVPASSVLGASPDGTLALVHYGDGELGLFDLHALTAQPHFVMAERAVAWALHSGTLSREGAIAVTSTRHSPLGPPSVNFVQAWHTYSGHLGRNGTAGGEGPVAVSPNGRYLLYGSSRNAVLWNLDTGGLERPMSLDALAHEVTCVDFAIDGRRYLYGGGDRVEVVNRLPGSKGASLLHDRSKAAADLRCARFSHDGRRVVTAAADGRIFLWDVG